MVYSNEENLNENTVLYRAFRLGYFQDAIDMSYANVDDLVTENDIEFFKENCYPID